jgi:hypothetical protein
MRQKSHPTTIELVNHNPTSISYHQINYRKSIQVRLTGAHPRKEEVYQNEEEGEEKETGKARRR